ncbi:MAG: glycosyltransferase [Ignavibacteria bacterium]|jgi:hypothetical protein|nr:glycosyltransferase [Ignavibacteria bacterium]
MKKTIRIYFTDFWSNFIKEDNFFLWAIKEKYDVILDKETPEYLIYSMFGDDNINYDCVKIFFCGENVRVNYKNCDWSISSDYIDNERHYRLPIYYYMCGDINHATESKPAIDAIVREKTGFCNFVYSNPSCKKRNDFFHTLSKYKRVDSAGRHLNNMQMNVDNKMDFIKNYKFTIAFENSEYPGYTTEKLLEPLLAHTIPIYWGNPLVANDFNTKAFLSYYDFPDEQALINRIIEIDNDDELLAQYLIEPIFVDNKVNLYVDKANFVAFFEKIFTTEITQIANKIYSKPTPIKHLLLLLKHIEWQTFFFLFRLKNYRPSKTIYRLKKKLLK